MALARMLERREASWHRAVADGSLPRWLVAWVDYCRELAPTATPSYAHLRSLIGEGEREQAARAAAACERVAAQAAKVEAAAAACGWNAAAMAAEE